MDETTNREDIDQLLDHPKLRRIKGVLGEEFARALERQLSHPELLRRPLREEWQTQQMRYMEHRIRRARLPERWSLTTYP